MKYVCYWPFLRIRRFNAAKCILPCYYYVMSKRLIDDSNDIYVMPLELVRQIEIPSPFFYYARRCKLLLES